MTLGWSVHSINLTPNTGTLGLEKLAVQVAEYIESIFEPEHPIDLIGFSMGGIVTRYYLQRLGGISRVHRYISIAAPNHGTLSAYLLPLPGIAQMRPDSPLLQDLNSDRGEMEKINSTVIWTPYDLMIFPASSSSINVGKEVMLPVLLHGLMPSDSKVLSAVTTALCEPLKPNHHSRRDR